MPGTWNTVSGFEDLLKLPLGTPQSPPLQSLVDVVMRSSTPTPCVPLQPYASRENDDGRIRPGVSSVSRQVMDFLALRNIRGLVHFTPLQNLESILRFGLVPRSDLEAMQQAGQTSFTYTDRHRYDGKKSTCLSVCFPNGDLFYCKRHDHEDWKWVVIILEVEDIVCHPETTFSVDNAARGGVRTFSGPDGIRALYGTCPQHWKCPPNRQAEVRVPRTIDPTLIKTICCNGATDVPIVRAVADKVRSLTGSTHVWNVPLATRYFSNPRPPGHADMPYS